MDVVTIGETMAIFTSETQGRMRYAKKFGLTYGGAESNVAIGLSRLGHKVGWISKVGNDEFGQGILGILRSEGVDVSRVLYSQSSSTGLLMKEPRRLNVFNIHYYRKNSAASELKPEDLEETYIAKAKYLHITGITPALSESCRLVILEAIKIAKKNNVKIIFDPNIRLKLWDAEKAKNTLLSIIKEVDIVLPGVDECKLLFGEEEISEIAVCFKALGVEQVVVKVGEKGAYKVSPFTDEIELVPGFPMNTIVDPVGAGDGFAAGYISGLLDNLPESKAIERANAVGALVTQTQGDFEGLPDLSEINALIEGMNQDIIR